MQTLVGITIILLAVVVVAVTIAVAFGVRYNNLAASVTYVVDNDEYCANQEGPCQLEWDDTLAEPLALTTDFDTGVARYAADLVARVSLFYSDTGVDALRMPPSLQLDTLLHYNDRVIGYVARSATVNVAYVVFRGTAHVEEWQRDFDYRQTAVAVADSDDVRCHTGFVTVFESVKAELARAAAALGDRKLVITGHSLGAALATLASLHLSRHETYVYVFGGPRVCESVPELAAAFWRLDNTTDLIPAIPLSVMPNIKDKTEPYRYAHGGKSARFTDNRRSLTNNHLLPVYIHALENPNFSF